MDIVDYRIQRAFICCHTQDPAISEDDDVSDQEFASIIVEQERYDGVLAYYLAELISLGRAAELLELLPFDLRLPFSRLGIPLRLGQRSIEEVDCEALALTKERDHTQTA